MTGSKSTSAKVRFLRFDRTACKLIVPACILIVPAPACLPAACLPVQCGPLTLGYHLLGQTLEQGDEIGMFHLGGSAILLATYVPPCLYFLSWFGPDPHKTCVGPCVVAAAAVFPVDAFGASVLYSVLELCWAGLCAGVHCAGVHCRYRCGSC